MGWSAQSVQFAWFGSGLEGIDAGDLYLSAFGAEAETFQKNRVPSAANPFWSRANGTMAEKYGDVQIQPGRVDVILRAANREGEDAPVIAAVDTLQTKGPAIASALSTLGGAIRLALVVELVKLQADLDIATNEAMQLAGVNFGEHKVSDFLLQLNKRRGASSIDGVNINRLCRWGVASFQNLRIDMGQETANTYAMTRVATSVSLDLNTVPSGVPLEKEKQAAIFKELIQEALRLSENPAVSELVRE